MSKFSIGKPAKGGGFDKAAHEGELLAFVSPTDELTNTAYGESTAARCAYVVNLDKLEVFEDVLLFGAALAPRLYESTETIVAGRLVKGEAQPGRNAPWLLEDPTDEELGVAEAFFESFATQLPSGRLVLDTDAMTNIKAVPGDVPF
jgi:hypothetical protein